MTKKYSPTQIADYKAQILGILDAGEAKTLASAARAVGVSPTKVYDWNKSDEAFREQVKQAQKVLADKLIEELLEDDTAKMPQVTAKIFIIKGLKPEFRENYKIVEFQDKRGITILEELRRLGKEAPKEGSKTLPVGTVFENPLAETVERVENAKQSPD